MSSIILIKNSQLVTRVFEKVQLAKRALREIVLLRHFASHENITGLIDVDAISPDFDEMYVGSLLLSVSVLIVISAIFSWRCADSFVQDDYRLKFISSMFPYLAYGRFVLCLGRGDATVKSERLLQLTFIK